MKRLFVAVLSCLAASMAWAFDSAAKGTVQYPDYALKKRCMAYKEDDPQLGRYYIGECVFELNFQSQPDQPINFVNYYNEFTKSNSKHFPPFEAKKCSLNVRKDRFNFNIHAPHWSRVDNNYVNYEKVKNDNGDYFALAVTLPQDTMGPANHMFTAEVVCVGKSRDDLAKMGKPASSAAATKVAPTS